MADNGRCTSKYVLLVGYLKIIEASKSTRFCFKKEFVLLYNLRTPSFKNGEYEVNNECYLLAIFGRFNVTSERRRVKVYTVHTMYIFIHKLAEVCSDVFQPFYQFTVITKRATKHKNETLSK